jgi:hypothetical protein
VAKLNARIRNDRTAINREKGGAVTLIVLIIIAVLLVGGLWYVRSRRT